MHDQKRTKQINAFINGNINQIMLKNREKCKVSSCIPKGSEDKQRASFFFF